MKVLFVVASVLAACGAMAQQSVARNGRSAEMVRRETPGRHISILDVRREPADAPSNAAIKVQQMTSVKTVYVHKPEEAKVCGLTVARDALKKDTAVGVVVVICDAGEAPSLAVYPEDRMAVINAERVRQGAESKVAVVRLEKEVFRAVAYIAGGIDEAKHSALKPVLSVQELDALTATTFSPAIAMTIAEQAKKFNFSRVENVPYRVAVMRGWAPAPTNDVQKEIWAKFNQKNSKK